MIILRFVVMVSAYNPLHANLLCLLNWITCFRVIMHCQTRALIRRAVKRTGPSKKVSCSRLRPTKTLRRFYLLTLELWFLKKLHETLFYVNQQLFWCIFCSEAIEKGEFFWDENRTLNFALWMSQDLLALDGSFWLMNKGYARELSSLVSS